MKIVFLHPAHWEQSIGGAELQISFLAKHFNQEGHDIHIIFEDKGDPIDNLENLNLHAMPKIPLRKTFGQRWILYKPQIEKLLKEISPDVIYTRFFSSWNGIASLYSRNKNCKHIWALSSDKDLSSRQSVKLIFRPLDWVEIFLARKAFKHSDYIITQNSFQKTELKRIYKRDGKYAPKVYKTNIDVDLKKDKEKMNILWIGNLKSVKNPKFFLDLVEQFNGDYRFNFIMIGRKNDKFMPAIRSTIKKFENFSYLGELSQKEVFEQLQASHVLINSSDYEGFPNTYIEAWAHKLIVLSKNVNPDNLLTSKTLGFVCPDIKEMRDKLITLSLNRNYLHNLGEDAQRFVQENYSYLSYLKRMKILFLAGVSSPSSTSID